MGFGFDAKESENHFYLVGDKKIVEVYERFRWNENEQKISKQDVLKVRISRKKWSRVSMAITQTFNMQLKAEGKKGARFLVAGTAIERLYGKELVLLLWAIENVDAAEEIATAVNNWNGLTVEERWWLYTMTNATAGKVDDNTGWRVALKYAFCDIAVA
ncbi:DUF3780 domain-containing protein [Candidatus Epulonipiscium viviparus]|uniref:DUF3780 domain-containing protein n=1 Tax=Candidatus Epulonipiscium viviparus TaxID=420336 RepID=UPI0005C51F69|nr:DUF3780 domain-containing protein [Candidatus Epulopiscium viviparus]